jgi:hypothetical protein
LIRLIATKLSHGDAGRASSLVVRLTHDSITTNSQVIAFQVRYCRIDPCITREFTHRPKPHVSDTPRVGLGATITIRFLRCEAKTFTHCRRRKTDLCLSPAHESRGYALRNRYSKDRSLQIA